MESNTTTSKQIDISVMPLSWRHIGIVSVASLGQLVGTAVATIAGVIIPMLNILAHPELSSVVQGLIGAANLLGICVGSALFGQLIDRYGYLLFFRLCPLLITVASVVAVLCASVPVLIICLFIIGLGIGGEYSLDSGYVSELMPTRYKALMVGVTKTASALGNIIAAALCFGLLILWREPSVWPRLMWIVAAIGVIMLLVRIKFYESPRWLLSKGRTAAAEKAVKQFLGPEAEISPEMKNPAQTAQKTNLFRFIKENGKKVILSGIPWACEGLGVYGIGVFLPILVMALGLERFGPGDPAMLHVTDSVRVTLWISCIILPGFIAGLILIRKGKKVTAIQTWGFLLCTIALIVLIPAYELHWDKWIAIGAFMAFEFFLNMGPHLVTYVLPPKIYPVADRGQGVGIAASIGKIGAVLGVFVIPILLKAGGASLVLWVSAATMAIGAAVTFLFRKTAD